MSFEPDARIAASSDWIMDLPLCQARLQEDARFPWIVLVPRRTGLIELADLGRDDLLALWPEAARAGEAVRAIGRALARPPLKLNHGQLGNVVAQLHLHVVGRWAGDGAWPGPVWGQGELRPYADGERRAALEAARAALLPAGGVPA